MVNEELEYSKRARNAKEGTTLVMAAKALAAVSTLLMVTAAQEEGPVLSELVSRFSPVEAKGELWARWIGVNSQTDAFSLLASSWKSGNDSDQPSYPVMVVKPSVWAQVSNVTG